MSEDQALGLVATLGALTLVLAALLSRRLPGRLLLRLGLAWLAIFAVGFLAVRTIVPLFT